MTPKNRRARRGAIGLALAGVLTAGVAACGGDPAGSAREGRLTASLRGIPGADAGALLTYWHVPEARRLVAEDKELYAGLHGYGILEVAAGRYEKTPPRTAHGFDETDVDTAVLVGPQSARLTGRFDVAAVTRALKDRGWTQEKTDGGVLLREDGQQVAASDTVHTSAYGPESGLPPLVAPERSVADDPAYQAVARCVGEDAYLVTFFGKEPKNGLPGLTLFAIGARAQPDGSSRERLCALTESAGSARGVADALRAKTADGERFAGATVATGEGPDPVVTMEWATKAGSGKRPGDQNLTYELPRVLLPPR